MVADAPQDPDTCRVTPARALRPAEAEGAAGGAIARRACNQWRVPGLGADDAGGLRALLAGMVLQEPPQRPGSGPLAVRLRRDPRLPERAPLTRTGSLVRAGRS